MNRLPIDIIINHIIPYTYAIQPKGLLLDIVHYVISKGKLLDEKYDCNMIKHEILAMFYFHRYKLEQILNRRFLKIDQGGYSVIYNYRNHQRFNMLFGLFTKEERQTFLEYILEDDGIWIKNGI